MELRRRLDELTADDDDALLLCLARAFGSTAITARKVHVRAADDADLRAALHGRLTVSAIALRLRSLVGKPAAGFTLRRGSRDEVSTYWELEVRGDLHDAASVGRVEEV